MQNTKLTFLAKVQKDSISKKLKSSVFQMICWELMLEVVLCLHGAMGKLGLTQPVALHAPA